MAPRWRHGKLRELGVPMVGPRERRSFLFLWTMKNGRQIRTELAEKRLKLDSSSLDYEIAPTRPVPAPAVRISSRSSHALKLGG